MTQILNNDVTGIAGTTPHVAASPRQQAWQMAAVLFPATGLLSAGALIWLMTRWHAASRNLDASGLMVENWSGGASVVLTIGVAYLLASLWSDLPRMRLPLIAILIVLSGLVGGNFWKAQRTLQIEHHSTWLMEEARMARLLGLIDGYQDMMMRAKELAARSNAAYDLPGKAQWDGIAEKLARDIESAKSEKKRIEQVRDSHDWSVTLARTGALAQVGLLIAIAVGCALASGRLMAASQRRGSECGT